MNAQAFMIVKVYGFTEHSPSGDLETHQDQDRCGCRGRRPARLSLMQRPKRPPSGEGIDHVTCRLCGRAYRVISMSHLHRRHGWDPEHPILEYQARFPAHSTRSRETKRLQRRTLAEHFERLGRRWTRDRVRSEIRRRRTQGRALSYRAVLEEGAGLPDAATRFFGSWERAITSVGIRYETVRRTRRWTRAKVLSAIRALGRPLLEHHARRTDSGLVAAAVMHFGSWKKACSAAGVELPRSWPAWIWPRKKVISELRRRAKRGQPLTLLGLQRERLSGIITAALREFGTWRRALEASGVPCRDHRSQPRRWTREAILAAIRSHANPEGLVHWSRFREKFPGIERAAIKIFGSAQAAIRETGCHPRQRLHTRKELLALLKHLRKTHGYVSTGLLRHTPRPGFDHPSSALKRIFGGIESAKAAIGATENAARIVALAREAAKDR